MGQLNGALFLAQGHAVYMQMELSEVFLGGIGATSGLWSKLSVGLGDSCWFLGSRAGVTVGVFSVLWGLPAELLWAGLTGGLGSLVPAGRSTWLHV